MPRPAEMLGQILLVRRARDDPYSLQILRADWDTSALAPALRAPAFVLAVCDNFFPFSCTYGGFFCLTGCCLRGSEMALGSGLKQSNSRC